MVISVISNIVQLLLLLQLLLVLILENHLAARELGSVVCLSIVSRCSFDAFAAAAAVSE